MSASGWVPTWRCDDDIPGYPIVVLLFYDIFFNRTISPPCFLYPAAAATAAAHVVLINRVGTEREDKSGS